MGKFVRRNLTKTFESSDFWVWTKLVNSCYTLLLRVTITCNKVVLLLSFHTTSVRFGYHLFVLYLCSTVTNTEKRCLKDIYMPLLYQLWEELKEESYYQQTDVHTVNIGIRCDNYLVISKRIESVFNVECSLKEVELLILIHYFLCQSKAVKRLSTQ